MIRADHEDAGELALGARRGLERDGVHAGDLGQVPRQLVHELEGALRQRLGAAWGCRRAKPARRAMSSLILGLYFIVHEPSG